MKKIKNTFLLAFMMIIGFQLNAQFGVRAGVNFAKVNHDDAPIEIKSKSNLGYQLGVFYDAPITRNISLRPAVLYSIKGSELESVGTKSDFKTSYIEVPFDLVYKFNTGGNTVGIYAGPYVGFLVDATQEDQDIKELTKDLDYGINGGLLYELNGGLGLGLNYGLGLADINDGVIDIDKTISSLSAFVTYKF